MGNWCCSGFQIFLFQIIAPTKPVLTQSLEKGHSYLAIYGEWVVSGVQVTPVPLLYLGDAPAGR
jgi:hypothetical protein